MPNGTHMSSGDWAQSEVRDLKKRVYQLEKVIEKLMEVCSIEDQHIRQVRRRLLEEAKELMPR